MKTLLLLILFIVPPAFGANGGLSLLRNQLEFFEWSGPSSFIALAKKHKIEVCSFLEKEEPKLSGLEYSVRRIMLVSAEAKCPSRAALAKKYLKSKDPVVQEAAIRLTMKLDKPEREKLHKDVLHLRHNSKDAHVLRAVSDYLDLVSTQ